MSKTIKAHRMSAAKSWITSLNKRPSSSYSLRVLEEKYGVDIDALLATFTTLQLQLVAAIAAGAHNAGHDDNRQWHRDYNAQKMRDRGLNSDHLTVIDGGAA